MVGEEDRDEYEDIEVFHFFSQSYLLKKRLINQFYLFKSPNNLPDNKKKQIFTSANILSKYGNRIKVSSKLAKDTITIYKY